jgi:hypothetical protein
LDNLAVAGLVSGLEISEKPASLTDELQQSSAGVMILLMHLKVRCELVDPLGKKSHLHFGRTGIRVRPCKFPNDV